MWRPISIDSIHWTIGLRAALVPPPLDTRARAPVKLLLEQQCFSRWLCVLLGVFVRENDALLPSFFLQGRAAAVDSTHVVAKIARWFSREDGRWLSFLMEEWVGDVPVPTPEQRRMGGVSTFTYWCGGYGARLWLGWRLLFAFRRPSGRSASWYTQTYSTSSSSFSRLACGAESARVSPSSRRCCPSLLLRPNPACRA